MITITSKLYVIYNGNNKTNNAESYYILFYEVTFGPTSKLKLNGAEFALKLLLDSIFKIFNL